MKYLKSFEKYNPILDTEVKEYIDRKMSSGDIKEIFDIAGEKIPKGLTSDEFEKVCDDVKEKAIKHYTKFPEHMRNGKGLSISGIPQKNQKLTPTLTNIGGVVGRII